MGVVQGTSHPEHVVMDAESVSGHLLPSGSVYAFLAEHRRELFPDAVFADLFPSPRGRPSVPADVVALVLWCRRWRGARIGIGRGADVRPAVEDSSSSAPNSSPDPSAGSTRAPAPVAR